LKITDEVALSYAFGYFLVLDDAGGLERLNRTIQEDIFGPFKSDPQFNNFYIFPLLVDAT